MWKNKEISKLPPNNFPTPLPRNSLVFSKRPLSQLLTEKYLKVFIEKTQAL